MKNLGLPIGIFILAVLAGVAITILPGKSEAPATTSADPHANLIVVDVPKAGTKLSSTTLTITGKARGIWYFEASFPIQILNASGIVIATLPAQAQSDWMTTEFVPFSATVTFPAQPAGSAGTIVLKKDNPSGDPVRDDSISVPIVF